MAKWPYNTELWAKLRKRKLVTSPMCQPCAMRGRQTLANTVDHIVAIAGGGNPFPPLSGLMSMCGACHGTKTAARDRPGGHGVAVPGVNADGLPVDPSHPFFGEELHSKPPNPPQGPGAWGPRTVGGDARAVSSKTRGKS